jgi:hypothetical protein
MYLFSILGHQNPGSGSGFKKKEPGSATLVFPLHTFNSVALSQILQLYTISC